MFLRMISLLVSYKYIVIIILWAYNKKISGGFCLFPFIISGGFLLFYHNVSTWNNISFQGRNATNQYIRNTATDKNVKVGFARNDDRLTWGISFCSGLSSLRVPALVRLKMSNIAVVLTGGYVKWKELQVCDSNTASMWNAKYWRNKTGPRPYNSWVWSDRCLHWWSN